MVKGQIGYMDNFLPQFLVPFVNLLVKLLDDGQFWDHPTADHISDIYCILFVLIDSCEPNLSH